MSIATQEDIDIVSENLKARLKEADKKNKAIKMEFISKEIKPIFRLSGNGQMRTESGKNLFPKAIDLIDEVMEMDADEKYTLKLIKNGIFWSQYDRKYIHQVKITGKDLGTMKTKFSRGFKKLEKKDLVRRIKRGTYMINPLALIPSSHFAEEYEIYFNEHPREFYNNQKKHPQL